MLTDTPLYHTPELLGWCQDTALRQLNSVTTSKGKSTHEELGAIFNECLKNLPKEVATATTPPLCQSFEATLLAKVRGLLETIIATPVTYQPAALAMANATIEQHELTAIAIRELLFPDH